MTKGEIQAVLFVAASMLAGGLVLLVKQFHSDVLPDLGPAPAQGRASAEIQGLSAQTTGNALAMTGLSPGAGSDTGGEKSTRDDPYSRAASPGTDAGYPVTGVPSKSASSGNDLRVPVNTAPASELQRLPGIGPALAERIIAFREQSGGFSTVEQLLEVKGIGPAKLTRMRPFVELP
jgi:competence ComEA-like helix-hairpin-helix protein